MDFNEYLAKTHETAVYPDCGLASMLATTYAVLGLNGESGEVAEQIKKALRDDDGKITPERMANCLKELGDTLWYWVRTCYELDLDPNEVAQHNLDKLADRKDRGVLGGSGDNR